MPLNARMTKNTKRNGRRIIKPIEVSRPKPRARFPRTKAATVPAMKARGKRQNTTSEKCMLSSYRVSFTYSISICKETAEASESENQSV